MAEIEFETTEISASTGKETTSGKTLSAGDKLKGEVGVDEFSLVVPSGEEWDVVLSVRIKVRKL